MKNASVIFRIEISTIVPVGFWVVEYLVGDKYISSYFESESDAKVWFELINKGGKK